MTRQAGSIIRDSARDTGVLKATTCFGSATYDSLAAIRSIVEQTLAGHRMCSLHRYEFQRRVTCHYLLDRSAFRRTVLKKHATFRKHAVPEVGLLTFKIGCV